MEASQDQVLAIAAVHGACVGGAVDLMAVMEAMACGVQMCCC